MPKIAQAKIEDEVGDDLHAALAGRFAPQVQANPETPSDATIEAAIVEASVSVAEAVEVPCPTLADELQDTYESAAEFEREDRSRAMLEYARLLKRSGKLSPVEKSSLLTICQELNITPAKLEADIATHQRVVQLQELAITRDKQEAELIAACRRLQVLEENYKREHKTADAAVYAARRKFNLADRAPAELELLKESFPYLFGL